MRKVFNSHRQLCHVWAQNTQDEGRASSMFFEDGKLYSYGYHFCIARILPSGTVTFTTRDYSVSTSGHKADARSAVRHRRIVYCHDPALPAWDNRDYADLQIKAHLAAANTERKVKPWTRVESKLAALRAAREFNEYLAALPENEQGKVQPFDLAKLEVSAEDRAIVVAHAEALEAKRQAKWAKTAEERALPIAEKIARWRAHTYNNNFYAIPDMLRLSKDGTEVETSRGASIPVSHAKRLWPLIENVKAVGKPLTDRALRLGHFTLDEIRADGSIRVGCHDIAYSEIEAIAKALGLLEEATH